MPPMIQQKVSYHYTFTPSYTEQVCTPTPSNWGGTDRASPYAHSASETLVDPIRIFQGLVNDAED